MSLKRTVAHCQRPTSKWRGWMCSAERQVSVEKRHWPNQNTLSIQSHTIRTWILTCTVTNGKKPAHIPPQSSSRLTPIWPDLEAFCRKDEEGRYKQLYTTYYIYYNLRHWSRTLPELNFQLFWVKKLTWLYLSVQSHHFTFKVSLLQANLLCFNALYSS